MISKIISTVVLSIFGIAALIDFLIVYRGHLNQFGFLSLCFSVASLCAAVFVWRHWNGIHEAYTYSDTIEKDGVELPRAAWSERLGMGALFNLKNRRDRRPSKS
jgi:hypothetical protein